ncbi:PDDEXK nuclease domain-containing protein [Photorhabdus namnaonensis]|uniref:PDDEXK nuclease domain-containing protein n=1 Tax=Photorhabdus namnaonensis TaxID=1851568 RepID=UPI001F0B57F3|nr:PDDEXK nuclease domain-containing protein [Photorhabdus namnaonensis]
MILCQTKDQILAEYTLRGIQKPIGVSDYELTCTLPGDLKSSLPSIEDAGSRTQSLWGVTNILLRKCYSRWPHIRGHLSAICYLSRRKAVERLSCNL